MGATSAFVIGGASGIGLETARHFVARNVSTTIIDVDRGKVGEAESALKGQGGKVLGLTADVRDRQALDKAFSEGVARHGGVDALVFTAGVLRPALLAQMTDADYDLTFDVNTKGFWNSVKAALPYFPARGGSIVAISSSSGLRPKASNGAYGASKAALQFLMRTFALELAARQLRVNCVSPSTLDTPLTARFASGPAKGGYLPSAAPPLGRMCTVSDIAKAVLFLCSEDADFITGTTVPVDGGLTAGVPLKS
jgi:3-oxoacyl-[acyl-carrier protein] reductase